MAQAVAERTAVGDTLVEFLRDTGRRFGPKTALLFKPAFRYQRWSYAELVEGADRVVMMRMRVIVLKAMGRRVVTAANCAHGLVPLKECL